MTIASQVNIVKATLIRGWMSEQELTWLANVATRCSVIVEFGSYCGRSARVLADNTDGVVYAVDPWNGDYPGRFVEAMAEINTFVMPEFVNNLKDHIDAKKVIPVRTWSECFELPSGVSADFVFIDGDHRYLEVKKDIMKAKSLLKPGGMLAGHDYGHHGFMEVNKAVHELLGDIGVEDSIWWTEKF